MIFDAVLSAMKSLYLLRAQADVDTTRIGVVGISWGGYMTTMVCGLAGDDVKNRKWIALPAIKTSDDFYEAKLPAEAAEWFAVVSDDRPVTVSSDLIEVAAQR